MKIQNISNWNNQPSTTKNTKASGGSFEHVFNSHAKNDKHIENSLPSPHSVPIIEQIDSVKPLAFQNMRQIELAGLKNLVRDAFSDTNEQILHDIDSQCNDGTGENIDMKILDKLLGLCTENKDEI